MEEVGRGYVLEVEEEGEEPRLGKDRSGVSQVGDCKAWPDLHHHAAARTYISGVITLFHSFLYLPSTLHLSPFILRHSCA